jgi:hypothetical protein
MQPLRHRDAETAAEKNLLSAAHNPPRLSLRLGGYAVQFLSGIAHACCQLDEDREINGDGDINGDAGRSCVPVSFSSYFARR